MKTNFGLIYGIAVGTALTISLGIALDNFAIGFSIESGAGVAIGTALNLLYNKKRCEKKENK